MSDSCLISWLCESDSISLSLSKLDCMVSWYSLPSSKPEFLAKGDFFPQLQVIWPCYRILMVCIVILSLELLRMLHGGVFLTTDASNHRLWWIIWPRWEVCLHHSLGLLQSPFWLWTPLKDSCLWCQQVYRPDMKYVTSRAQRDLLHARLPSSNDCRMLQIIVRWNNLTLTWKRCCGIP